MNRKHLRQFDEETGEALEGFVAVLQPKRKNAFKDWVAMSQPALMEMAKADLGDEARRVLFAVLAHLDFQNFVLLNQSEIAAEIGLKRSSMSRAVKKLADHHILLKGPKVGRSLTYRLNPDYGWKGSAKEHHKELRKRMDDIGLSVVSNSRDPDTIDWVDQKQ